MKDIYGSKKEGAQEISPRSDSRALEILETVGLVRDETIYLRPYNWNFNMNGKLAGNINTSRDSGSIKSIPTIWLGGNHWDL